jgi:hypothetical protein
VESYTHLILTIGRKYMLDTIRLRDIQLQHSNDNGIYSQQFGFTLSKKQKERSEAGTGTDLILQAKPWQSVNWGWRLFY